jgi:hypothetical protein
VLGSEDTSLSCAALLGKHRQVKSEASDAEQDQAVLRQGRVLVEVMDRSFGAGAAEQAAIDERRADGGDLGSYEPVPHLVDVATHHGTGRLREQPFEQAAVAFGVATDKRAAQRQRV